VFVLTVFRIGFLETDSIVVFVFVVVRRGNFGRCSGSRSGGGGGGRRRRRSRGCR